MKVFCLLSVFVFLLANSLFAQDYSVQKINNDIYAVIRQEPPSLWFNPNTVFIIGKKDVIIVDSNISSTYTREVLAELKKITDKPVRYVINTHWHEDHIIGNHVYKDAFPNIKFIGHRSTLKDLPEIGGANRKGSVENGAGFVKVLKKAIETNKNLAGHSGFFPGYMTDMKYFPDKKISVAVQVNTMVPQNLGKSTARIALELAEIIGNEK